MTCRKLTAESAAAISVGGQLALDLEDINTSGTGAVLTYGAFA